MERDDKDKDPERGGRIRELRLAVRGRTQAQLARLLGVGERTFQYWEAGYTVPAVKLSLLAHALGTTPEYLLGETDDPAGDVDLEKRLRRMEALIGTLADDRVSGEQSARAGFERAAQRIAEVNDAVTALQKEMERRLDAQAETLSTLHAQLEEIRRAPQVQAAQDQAESDRPEGSRRTRGKDRRRPDQANG